MGMGGDQLQGYCICPIEKEKFLEWVLLQLIFRGQSHWAGWWIGHGNCNRGIVRTSCITCVNLDGCLVPNPEMGNIWVPVLGTALWIMFSCVSWLLQYWGQIVAWLQQVSKTWRYAYCVTSFLAPSAFANFVFTLSHFSQFKCILCPSELFAFL